MGRKSGFHVQRVSNELRRAIEVVQPTIVMSLAHERNFWTEVKRDFPQIFLVGRLFEDGQHWLGISPRVWAERCAALMVPYDAFVTFNEPPGINNNEITTDLAARHDDWCCQFRNRNLELGYQAIALNIATGNLHRNAIVNYFPRICQEFDYIGIHEYSARCMWDQNPVMRRQPGEVPKGEGGRIGYWYCQRYRDWHNAIIQKWPHRSGRFQMVVTECGVALGVIPGYGDIGWQGEISEEQYIESLIWYFIEMNQDPYCLGGAIFMVGSADPRWASFETLHLADRLAVIPEVVSSPTSPIPQLPEPPEEPNGGRNMDIKVVDLNYQERNFEYAKSKYGVAFRRAEVEPGQKVYRLVELWEKTGNTSLITQVLDEAGKPISNKPVSFYWSGAPQPPDPPTEVFPHDWYPRFVWGLTNANGEVGPGMGKGAYHGIGQGGPHAVWVHDPSIPSDICEKLGMLAGTFHDHLDQKFKLVIEGQSPISPPSGGGWVMVSASAVDIVPNCIVVTAVGERNFHDTQLHLMVADDPRSPYWVADEPISPVRLDRYEIQTNYVPTPGETSRRFWFIIQHPSGVDLSAPIGAFEFKTGISRRWDVAVEWRGVITPPLPPSGDLESRMANLENRVANLERLRDAIAAQF